MVYKLATLQLYRVLYYIIHLVLKAAFAAENSSLITKNDNHVPDVTSFRAMNLDFITEFV